MSIEAREVLSVVQGIREGYILIDDFMQLVDLEGVTLADADSVIDHTAVVIQENIDNNFELDDE